jgi:hypothetical protein
LIELRGGGKIVWLPKAIGESPDFRTAGGANKFAPRSRLKTRLEPHGGAALDDQRRFSPPSSLLHPIHSGSI